MSDDKKELRDLNQTLSRLNGTIELNLAHKLDRIAAALEKLAALKEKG